ncbi:helix-turn-helix domain-containing protein [Bacillus paranthracis]
MAIIINIDVMLAKRKMSVTELSEKVGITMANLSILKKWKSKSSPFFNFRSHCKALECQPGDILEYQPEERIKRVLHTRRTLFYCTLRRKTNLTSKQ